MLPHKLTRGKLALARLKVFEGVPPPYDMQKKLVVPSCYRQIRLKPGRRYADVGRLAHEVGWKYKHVIDTLEEKRKAKGHKYFADKAEKKAKVDKIKADPKVKAYNAIIEK